MNNTNISYIKSKSLGIKGSMRSALETLATAIDGADILSKEVTISAADIVATTAGKLGHAAGVPLVAASSSTKYVEFVGAVLLYKRDTAAYTAGGNLTINATGGSAVTGLIANSASLGAAASVVAKFNPLSTAATAIAINTGYSLVSSVAFTNPGTAAGTIKVVIYYREHSL